MDYDKILKLFETTPYDYRWAHIDEWKPAMLMVWNTFMKFEASDYSERGIKSFFEFISDDDIYRAFLNGKYKMMVALDGDRIIGVATIRNTNILSLLFVDENYHRQGVGSILVELIGSYIRDEMGEKELLVKAAPYAIEFYKKLDFQEIGVEQVHDGIRVTPMEKRL